MAASSPDGGSGAARVPRPVCEYDRAYRELIGKAVAPLPLTACSPETPEVREYPPPPSGGRQYALCNGHLSDLFDARKRSSPQVPLAGHT